MAPDVVYKTAAAAAAAAVDADVVKEQMHFAECSRCLEERCRKTCLWYLKISIHFAIIIIRFLTTREAAEYIISVVSVCLSVRR